MPGTIIGEAPDVARELPLEPWRYFLARSSDMRIISELVKARGRTLTVDNNKSGDAAFNFPMEEEVAPMIRPWRTCVVAQRGYQEDAEWFWSGPVSSVSKDYAAGKLNVSAVGWFELLLHRLILERVSYTNQDAGAIAFALLAIANAQRDTHITPGTSAVSQPRSRTYEVDSSIGAEIQALAELESGYDWYIDPVTRQLHILAKRGQDRPNCKWIFIASDQELDSAQKSSRGNLRNILENEDGATLTNDLYVRGRFGTGRADSLDSQIFYDVLFQEAVSLSDVSDNNILNAYANAEIVYRQHPRVTYTILPKPHHVEGVPLFGRDYDIGDTTYLTARRGQFSIDDQAVRVFGVSMSIDDSTGIETITRLQTSAD